MTPPEHEPDDLTDEAAGTSPFRRCLATNETTPASRMVRFVLDPDGCVTPDLAARLPGRGVWVTAAREKLATAVSRKAFARGFKASVRVPEDLTGMVAGLLLARCQSTLGMAKRSGVIILGFDQVRAELERRKPGWLIEASDGSADGRGKLIGLGFALYEKVRVSGALDSSELGMAFGRDHVVHGLLKTGRFADVWALDYRQLSGFRDTPEDAWLSRRA